MQTEQWSLQDAKNKFSTVVSAAQKGKAQIVTRRGVPAAVVVSMDVFEKFQQFESRPPLSFTDYLLNIPADDGTFERMDVQLRDFL
ncbi:MAG: type II toxin-antitoxin system Phd/YefM family antitoxin [Gammaproteobacteria bacterium]|nr:type II toxin-antitoxin system Phd/YefM family antitoxin [Gammaproteobacteria bacterium]